MIEKNQMQKEIPISLWLCLHSAVNGDKQQLQQLLYMYSNDMKWHKLTENQD